MENVLVRFKVKGFWFQWEYYFFCTNMSTHEYLHIVLNFKFVFNQLQKGGGC